MKSKKVLHILNSLLPSGAETMLNNSVDLWRGYDKYILSTACEIGNYASILKNSGYTIIHIYKSNILLQHLAVIKFLISNKFDVIHIHRESQSLFYELDAKIVNTKHIVRTFHSCFEFDGLLRMRRIVTRKLSHFLKVHQIAIGDSVYNNENIRFHNKCDQIIYNWYNDKKYHYVNKSEHLDKRIKLQFTLDNFYIISVGNCANVKNHKSIIEALKILLSKGYKVHYIHIGSGVQEIEEKKLVLDVKVDAQVSFMGRVDPEEYLAASNLFLMPSLYEGFGIAALEAMSIGMPVVLSEVSGLKDFKKYSFQNVSYCCLDAEDLACAIEYYYKKFLNNTLVNSASQAITIKENFGMKNSVNKYLEVYKQ